MQSWTQTKRFFSIMLLALVMVCTTGPAMQIIGYTGQANANWDQERQDLFSMSKDVNKGVFNRSRLVLYAVSGFGFIGAAVLAIFGRFSWRWLIVIGAGLMLMLSIESIIQFFTGEVI